MKTKLLITALLCALSINAASAETSGSLGVRHTSDYYFRGAQLSEDALQLNVGASTKVSGVDLSASFLTNQASDSANTNTLGIEAGSSILDKRLALAAGVYNQDTAGGNSLTEAYVRAGLDVLLSPTVTIYRDTTDSLFTYELGVCYGVDLGVADLTLCGTAGTTELTSSTDRDYTSLGARLSKEVGGITPHVQVALIDADDISSDTVVCLGIDFKF